jgi:hypothetical protein
MYTLVNNVSTAPINCNVGYNNSWIGVDNDANRELYAQASYVTNFDDFTVTLSAKDVNIGSVEIKDGNSNLKADVASANGYNALRVITQDLESDVDDISIGDRNGNLATVNPVLSALKVQVVNTDDVPNKISYADSANLDAFGRLRVSEPYSLFDSKSLHDLSPLVFSSALGGTGNIVFDNSNASVNLTTNSINSYAIRQTYSRFPYQPGKSQYALFTGVMEPQTDVIKRYGLFTSLTAVPFTPNVGLYFEASNGTMSVWINNINDGTTLTPSQSASRTNWNLDKMDGTGKSGINLLFNKAQIFLVDYEWLGVGRVRFGFVVDGKVYYCHEFNNANNTTAPYIFTPNLPIRAEIRQLGSTAGTFRVICQSVMSEGGQELAGVTHGIYTGYTGININSSGSRRAILGVRLQANKLDSVNQILNGYVGINPGSASTVAHFIWEIVLNPTIGGTTPVWTDVSNSNMQQFIASNATNTVTGGTVLLSGIANIGTPIDISTSNFQKFKRLGCSIDGIRDELYLVVTPLVNPSNNGVWGALTYVDTD